MAAPRPLSYAQFYRNSPDVLEGDYGAWMAGHATTAAIAPAAVRDLMINTSDAVPKVYLYLTREPDTHIPVIRTVFRPALYRALPGRPSSWDNKVYAFGTDLHPGNQITTVLMPADAFTRTSATALAPEAATMILKQTPSAPSTPGTRTSRLL